MPAAAAMIGSLRSAGVERRPSYHSRLTSSPTSKKKIAINPSAIHWCNDNCPKRGMVGPSRHSSSP